VPPGSPTRAQSAAIVSVAPSSIVAPARTSTSPPRATPVRSPASFHTTSAVKSSLTLHSTYTSVTFIAGDACRPHPPRMARIVRMQAAPFGGMWMSVRGSHTCASRGWAIVASKSRACAASSRDS
jgi:hypothetical protein